MDVIVERFKAFYHNLKSTDLSTMDELYSSDVIFRDPVHQIQGIAPLHDYMDDMYRKLTECRFEYLDQLVCEHSAYIKWNMHFRHESLGNKLITVRGVSQIQYDEKVIFHEDVYDMGELIYEHVPVIGGVTRWLKRRLVRGHQS